VAGCGVQVGTSGSIIQSATNPGYMQVLGGAGTNGFYVSNKGGGSGGLAVDGGTTLWGTTSAVGAVTTSSGITMNGTGLTGNGTTGVTLNGGNVSLGGTGQVTFPTVGMSLQAYPSGGNGNYINVTDSGSGKGGNLYVTGTTGNGTGSLYAASNVSAGGAMYAPIYYDSNNTEYWVEPSNTSVFNDIIAGGISFFNGNATNPNSPGDLTSIVAAGTVWANNFYAVGSGYFAGTLTVGLSQGGSSSPFVQMNNGWTDSSAGTFVGADPTAVLGHSCNQNPGVGNKGNKNGAVTFVAPWGLLICTGQLGGGLIWAAPKLCNAGGYGTGC
jgi:hypothetical protein